MLSLGCSDLCRVISFLVIWSIYFSSSLVHFRNKYLTRGAAQVFIPFISFCYWVFTQVVFYFFCNILFELCLSSTLVWWCQPPSYPIIIIIIIRTFHINASRWFFTGVWVTASILMSPGLFLVFWPFSTRLSFGWSPLVRQLPNPLLLLLLLFSKRDFFISV